MKKLVVLSLLAVCVFYTFAQTAKKADSLIILPVSVVIDREYPVDYNLVMGVYQQLSKELREHAGTRTVLVKTPYLCSFNSAKTHCLSYALELSDRCGDSLENNYTKEGQKLRLIFSSALPVDKDGKPILVTAFGCHMLGVVDIRYRAQKNFQTKAVSGALRTLAKLFGIHLDSHPQTWVAGGSEMKPAWTPELEEKMTERMKLWMVQKLPSEDDPPKKP